MSDEEFPVLITGGCMAGLSMALFLAQQGVRSLLVERHPSISPHPRAQAASPRTMELLRPLGLEDEVRAAETPNARYGNILQVSSLAGDELGDFDGPFRHETNGASATGWTLIGQDRLEPILAARAAELGADLRFGTELVRHRQDDDGVTAVIRDASGERTVRAGYLIAADGNRSSIRDGLGITTSGRGVLGRQMIILFQAALQDHVRGREFFLCFVSNPQVHGVLGQLDADAAGRWVLAPSLQPGQTHEDFTDADCVELVRAAAGDPGLEVEIENVDSWEIAERVADGFRSGRVFLVGDSAHLMPPTGGFGGNLGVQDAHNLAWKLALVLRGAAAAALLDSYEAERLPIAIAVAEQAVIRYLQRSGLDQEIAARHRPESTVLFGHVYGAEPGAGLDDLIEDPLLQRGLPGTRAPHLESCGVHDLMRGNFVLLTANGERWRSAVSTATAATGIAIDAHSVETDEFTTRYEIGETGAVLVRPDGFVAWRWTERPDEAAAELTGRLRHACGFATARV
ncbi:putative polyketide hydroxylase [Lentzea albidocapillata subsp. violacea]|uniref:Putative polyketide hydroxylase n=1 Tax=Lentzea albidocapillata subsp. violacea TaxID=128104 RepID=A0A1G9LT98_9PSEU|nr:FAD-dependent monooxygenase [Lentzea albidocapillata]SDL65312.1 putative polyketide hydroxylase [Lentzea albidocapillata subsp. violacea]